MENVNALNRAIDLINDLQEEITINDLDRDIDDDNKELVSEYDVEGDIIGLSMMEEVRDLLATLTAKKVIFIPCGTLPEQLFRSQT